MKLIRNITSIYLFTFICCLLLLLATSTYLRKHKSLISLKLTANNIYRSEKDTELDDVLNLTEHDVKCKIEGDLISSFQFREENGGYFYVWECRDGSNDKDKKLVHVNQTKKIELTEANKKTLASLVDLEVDCGKQALVSFQLKTDKENNKEISYEYKCAEVKLEDCKGQKSEATKYNELKSLMYTDIQNADYKNYVLTKFNLKYVDKQYYYEYTTCKISESVVKPKEEDDKSKTDNSEDEDKNENKDANSSSSSSSSDSGDKDKKNSGNKPSGTKPSKECLANLKKLSDETKKRHDEQKLVKPKSNKVDEIKKEIGKDQPKDKYSYLKSDAFKNMSQSMVDLDTANNKRAN